MKKLSLLLMLLCGLTAAVFAQVEVTATNNNVVIGTGGTSQTHVLNGTFKIPYNTPSNTTDYLKFYNDDASLNSVLEFTKNLRIGTSLNNPAITISNSAVTIPNLTVSSNLTATSINSNSGNLGVGTTTPNEKLEVNGNILLKGPNKLICRGTLDTMEISNNFFSYIKYAKSFIIQPYHSVNYAINIDKNGSVTIPNLNVTNLAVNSISNLNNIGNLTVGYLQASQIAASDISVFSKIYFRNTGTYSWTSDVYHWIPFIRFDLASEIVPESADSDCDAENAIAPTKGLNPWAYGDYGLLGGADHRWRVIYGNNIDCYTLSGMDVWSLSDERIKENIVNIDSALTNIVKLKGVKFDYKATSFSNGKNDGFKNKSGFLAQDVNKVLPNLVKYDKKKDRYSVNYMGFIPYLVEAIKTQQTQIDSQNNRISDLEKAVADLTKAVEALKKKP